MAPAASSRITTPITGAARLPFAAGLGCVLRPPDVAAGSSVPQATLSPPKLPPSLDGGVGLLASLSPAPATAPRAAPATAPAPLAARFSTGTPPGAVEIML